MFLNQRDLDHYLWMCILGLGKDEKKKKKKINTLPTELLNGNEERSCMNSIVKLVAVYCADAGKSWETNKGLLGHRVLLNLKHAFCLEGNFVNC